MSTWNGFGDWLKRVGDSGYYFSAADLDRAAEDEDFARRAYGFKEQYANAATKAGRDAAHAGMEALRAERSYSGGADGSRYESWAAPDAAERAYLPDRTAERPYRPDRTAERAPAEARPAAAPYTPPERPAYTPPEMPDAYGETYRAALERYAAPAPFTYDPQTDPRWSAYRKAYVREGRRATEDTLGQAAARTGGMPSTAAVTAASQAGDYYNAQLTDKLPELYDLAYAMYTGEQDRLYRSLSALADARKGELDRYSTVLGQWNADRSRDDMLEQRDWERARHEMEYADARADSEREWDDRQRRYADERADAARDYADARQRYADARYDAALDRLDAERRYADERADSERDWADRRSRYADERADAERDYADARADSARADALTLARLAAQYGDLSYLEGLGVTPAALPAAGSAAGRSGGSGGGKPDLTAAQTLSALRDGVRSQKVLDAYEYWYGEPYTDGAADAADAGAEAGVDYGSILDLGYGPVSAGRLAELESAGEVERYLDGGVWRFRRTRPAAAPPAAPTLSDRLAARFG